MTELPRLPSGPPEPPPPGNKAAGPPDGTREGSAALVKDLRVLLVEQNSIFALAVEDILLRHGAFLVHVAASRKEALQRLAVAQYDVALVDLKLGGGGVAVAARLQVLGIPFAFAVSYGDQLLVPPPFASTMVIDKPCTEEYLLSRLAQLLGPGP